MNIKDKSQGLNYTSLWVYICKEKKVKLESIMQEYTMNPSKFLLSEIKSQEESFLYLVDFVKQKYVILGYEELINELH